jgi:hypothetical protein
MTSRKSRKKAEAAASSASERRPTRGLGVKHLDPLVREEVLRLCDGDESRVEVISPTEARIN